MNKEIIKATIQKELNEQIEMLNSGDYEYYRDELDINDTMTDQTTAELIQNADIESPDFNIGFEQGFMRGLEVALSVIK